MGLFIDRLKSLLREDDRRVDRKPTSQVVAYYWEGGTPTPHPIRDISIAGAYLVTEHRWRPGTIVNMTLQRTDQIETDVVRALPVQAKVVRQSTDGVGLRFLLPVPNKYRDAYSMASLADRKALRAFLTALIKD